MPGLARMNRIRFESRSSINPPSDSLQDAKRLWIVRRGMGGHHRHRLQATSDLD